MSYKRHKPNENHLHACRLFNVRKQREKTITLASQLEFYSRDLSTTSARLFRDRPARSPYKTSKHFIVKQPVSLFYVSARPGPVPGGPGGPARAQFSSSFGSGSSSLRKHNPRPVLAFKLMAEKSTRRKQFRGREEDSPSSPTSDAAAAGAYTRIRSVYTPHPPELPPPRNEGGRIILECEKGERESQG